MNAFFFVVLSVLIGGIICFSLGRLIEEVIRELKPNWLLTSNHHDQVHEQPRIQRVKFIPKRPSVNTAPTGQERKGIVRPVIVTLVVIGSLFSDFPKVQDQCALSSGISHFAATEFMDGVRMEFWPGWETSDIDNIISRENLFWQEITYKKQSLDSIPEGLSSLWAWTENDWLVRHRISLFRHHT